VTSSRPSTAKVLNCLQRYELAKAKQLRGTQLRRYWPPSICSDDRSPILELRQQLDTLSGPGRDVPWKP